MFSSMAKLNPGQYDTFSRLLSDINTMQNNEVGIVRNFSNVRKLTVK